MNPTKKGDCLHHKIDKLDEFKRFISQYKVVKRKLTDIISKQTQAGEIKDFGSSLYYQKSTKLKTVRAAIKDITQIYGKPCKL